MTFTPSILLYIASSLSGGYVLLCFLRRDRPGIGESLLTGSSAIALLVMLPAVLFDWPLRLMGLVVLSLGVLVFPLHLVFRTPGRVKLPTSKSCYMVIVPVLLAMLALPPMLGSLHVRVWGDEITYWATVVKGMIHYDRFGDSAIWGLVCCPGIPPLWPLMSLTTLTFLGEMHEAAGRILTLLLVLGGALFVYDELSKTWKLPGMSSMLWAAVMFTLVVVPAFPWSASWYPDVAFSVFLMAGTYSLVLGLASNDKMGSERLVPSSLFQAVCVGLRSDGFIFTPLFVLIGICAVRMHPRKMWRRKLLCLALSLIPSFLVFTVWQWYTWQSDIRVAGGIMHFFRLARLGWNGWTSIALPKLQDAATTIGVFWWALAPQCVSVFGCLGIALSIWRWLSRKEKLLAVAAMLFPVYKLIELFVANLLLMPGAKAYFVRYTYQTAPIVYLALGVLALEFVKMRRPSLLTGSTVRVATLLLLGGVFLVNVATGSLLARLPSDLNDYIEHLANKIRADYPEFTQIQFIAQQSPHYVNETWRYYALPDIHSKFPCSVGRSDALSLSYPVARDSSIQTPNQYWDALHQWAVQAILVYETDEEWNRLSGLDLSEDDVYLIALQDDTLNIVWSEKRPLADPYGMKWRTRALYALIRDLKRMVGRGE